MVQNAHLSPSARVQLSLSDEDRVLAIHSSRWIQHPRAKRALNRLNFLFTYPKCARMQCLLIYGDSGIGKTMILEKFLREHPSTFDQNDGIARIPIVSAQMPPVPDEKRFYAQLLASVGAPMGPDDRLHRIEDHTIRLFRRLAPKIIVIDEVHHLLAGTAREQRRSLNLLKFIANELRICMVVMGTSDALVAVQSDAQIASRFEPCHLPRWTASDDFRGFLAAYAKGLPLHEPSNVAGVESVNLLLSRSGGVTGRVTLILARAAEMSIRAGEESISVDWIERASRDLDLAPLGMA